MKLLEEVLFLCNKVVVYLEQARDIYGAERAAPMPTLPPAVADNVPASAAPGGGAAKINTSGNAGIDKVVVEEIIKKYFYARQKVFNFYKAWKKFQAEDKTGGPGQK